METRGRKKEDKVRISIALGTDLIDEIKGYAKQSGKNVSVFLEEVLAQKGKNNYKLAGWMRHERKHICFRFPQETIDYIKSTTRKDNVTYESLVEAKLRQYASSPQPMLEKTAPIAVKFITTGEGRDEFFEAFKNLCVAYGTESDYKERTKDYRQLVAQKLMIRCTRSLTDSQFLKLEKTLQEFCGKAWKRRKNPS